MTPRRLYHAARRTDRASIERLGLLGVHVIGGPTRPKWNIAGQRPGLYLVTSVDGARRYIAHWHDRFHPWWASTNDLVRREHLERFGLMRHPNFASMDWDIWEATMADEKLLPDGDWVEEAYSVQADIPLARIRLVAEWKLAEEGALAAADRIADRHG